MPESFVTGLIRVIGNPLVIIGLLLVLMAAFLRDERSAQSPQFKPTRLFKQPIGPLPTWAYRILILMGLVSIFGGILQVAGVLGADLPSLSRKSNQVDIESFPVKAFRYDGAEDAAVNQGKAELSVIYSDGIPAYIFNFELPYDAATPGYAGIDFWFEPVQDLTGYASLEIVLLYYLEPVPAEVFVKDTEKQANYLLLAAQQPPGGSLQVNGTEYTYRIPLSSFWAPDFARIQEIGLSVDTDLVLGEHEITLKRLRLVKKE